MRDLYYDYYLVKHPEGHKRYISYNDWKSLWGNYAENMREKLINKGEIHLPGKMGKVKVLKIRTKKKPINWAHYRATGELKPHDNSHTDGYLLKIAWEDKPSFHSQFYFSFVPNRELKSELSHAVRNDPNLIDRYEEGKFRKMGKSN